MLPAFVPDEVPRMPFGALVLTAVVLLSALAEAQTGSGLAAVRARLLASNGVLVVAPDSSVDLDAGAMTAAEAHCCGATCRRIDQPDPADRVREGWHQVRRPR